MQFLFKHRWLRRLAIASGALLLLWLLLWALVPVVARSQIEKQASAQLGRQVSVGRVEFAPWSLELTLHDLAVARATAAAPDAVAPNAVAPDASSADAALPQLEIARIHVNASLQSLLRLGPVLDAVEVDAPVLRLTQSTPGHFDVDDVLLRLSQPGEPSRPVRFALYNIALRDGRVQLWDQVQQRRHELDQLQLRIPFISNLQSQRDIKVLPHLAFQLDGSRFESSAESTPFTDGRQTVATLRWQGLDLAPYLGYVPASSPVRPQSGVLEADLRIAFEQQERPELRISGQLSLSGVALHDRADAPLLRFERLAVVLKNLQPLQSLAELESVHLQGPELFASRDAQGRLNWLELQARSGDAPAGAAAAPAPWQLALPLLDMAQATVHWNDRSAQAGAGGAALEARGLAVQARGIHWPLREALHFSAHGEVQAVGAADKPALLQLRGTMAPGQGQVAIAARQLPLQMAAPYLSRQLAPELAGVMSADAGFAWNGPAMVVHVGDLSVQQLGLRDKAAPVDVGMLQLAQARVDLLRQHVAIDRLALRKPRLGVMRDGEGRWMFERWLAPRPASTDAAGAGQGGSRPWALKLQAIEVDGGELAFRDEAPAVPGGAARAVSLDLTDVRLRLGAIEPLAAQSQASPLELSARVASGRRVQSGSLSLRGAIGLAPLALEGRLQARSLPLHAFEPYFSDRLNVELVRADGGFLGQLRFASLPAGPLLAVQGDAELNELRIRSALASPVQASVPPSASPSAAGAVAAVLSESTADRARTQAGSTGLGLRDELLAWKTLAVRGLDLRMEPASPLRVSVRETALSDFFARVIVQRNGRINLQDIVKTAKSEQSIEQNEAPAGTPQANGAASRPAAESAAPAAIVQVGPIVLTGGKVQFSDYFIQPNYSADLSELAGRLSAFSSQPPQGAQGPQLAELELRGKAQGTASLEITGQVNPLARPLALDVRAQMRDLELAPLSPYSIKYAGHGIERGKLSMDVNYKVEPDGQLTARNKLVLHQLTFGDEVKGAPASLPVRLAVALLADRDGVIDLDLPISGSLNDPQFRLAPVIFRVIGNLVMKAVTAPFALLAGAFGGENESAMVGFAPGRAELDAKARESLDQVAASLRERPALRLTVVGEARDAQDRDAWRQAALERLLLAQKRRQALREGRSAQEVTEVLPAETPALLKALYSRADFPKPRNAIGLSKEVPPEQMRALLMEHIAVPDDAIRELALARGVAVRDYLAGRQLPLERLFLGAPKTDADEQDWAPRAQLSLSTR